MRVVKEREVRQGEILDNAEELFNTKGYGETSIGDILEKTGIARGTLYYHFKSKEEILNAVIERKLDGIAAAMRKVSESDLSVIEKFYKIIEIQKGSGTLMEGLHNIENAQLHQKSFTKGLQKFSPIYCDIVEEGMDKGLFRVERPYETVELLLCASRITDPGIFTWTKKQIAAKNRSFVSLLERALGTEDGFFTPLLPLLDR